MLLPSGILLWFRHIVSWSWDLVEPCELDVIVDYKNHQQKQKKKTDLLGGFPCTRAQRAALYGFYGIKQQVAAV